MGEITRDTLPPGVLNIIAGGDALRPWITEHPGIDKISFTGSVATGKEVLASASTNLKRVTLELGGNDAAIVLDDLHPVKVAANVFWAAFANSGQICVAIKRRYVHDRCGFSKAQRYSLQLALPTCPTFATFKNLDFIGGKECCKTYPL